MNPVLGVVLFSIAFILFSFMLFYKMEISAYVYTGIAVVSIFSINSSQRLGFLKEICGHTLWKIRLLENIAVAIPFCLFLLYQTAYVFSLVIFLFSIILAFTPIMRQHSVRLPTPYFHRPFEFIIGFRKYLLLVLFSLFLMLMAYKSDNMNLGLFSIVIHFGIILSYLGFLEPSNYITIYNKSSKGFLIEKIKTTILYTSVSIFPTAVIQLITFPTSAIPLLFIILIGLLILIYFLICKYSNYPDVMSLPHTILFITSIFLPILLFYTVPLYWKKSRQKINHLLQ